VLFVFLTLYLSVFAHIKTLEVFWGRISIMTQPMTDMGGVHGDWQYYLTSSDVVLEECLSAIRLVLVFWDYGKQN